MLEPHDEWALEGMPEAQPVMYCDCCGAELFCGDTYYAIMDENICEDCLDEYYKRRID